MATFCWKCIDPDCEERTELDARIGQPPNPPRCKIHNLDMRRDYQSEGALVRTAWPTDRRPYRVAQRPKAAIRAEDEKKRRAERVASAPPPIVGKTKFTEVTPVAD